VPVAREANESNAKDGVGRAVLYLRDWRVEWRQDRPVFINRIDYADQSPGRPECQIEASFYGGPEGVQNFEEMSRTGIVPCRLVACGSDFDVVKESLAEGMRERLGGMTRQQYDKRIGELEREMNYWRERANFAEANARPIGYVVAAARASEIRPSDLVAIQLGMKDPYDKPAPKEAERKSNGIGARFSNIDLDDEEPEE
jgi:hypothetical protein